jgi:hypothetical protein
MASTYSSTLRLELQATGENRGAWGTRANTDFQLVDEALAGLKTIVMSDANKTLTASNALTDEARPMFLKFTGTLTANRTITIPTVSKLYFMQNATTGGFTLTITTGGSTVATIQPSGSPGTQWKLIYTDAVSVWSNDSLATASSSSQRWNIQPSISATGIMEVGSTLDFHNTNTDTNDFNVRLSTGDTLTDLYVVPQGGVGRKVWNAGNMGPASGLNADLLDGYHASDIQFVDAPSNGKYYVRRNGAWIAIDAPWTIDSNGDVILNFGAGIKVRIRTDGFIRTASDVQIYSSTVVSGG